MSGYIKVNTLFCWYGFNKSHKGRANKPKKILPKKYKYLVLSYGIRSNIYKELFNNRKIWSQVDKYYNKIDFIWKDNTYSIYNKLNNINSIYSNLERINKRAIKRKNQIRTKLQNKILALKEVDKERFEQEIIYYIEKYDINEELIRLHSHLNLFQKNINSNKPVGKKLGFISQEIGREINTIGSKANDFNIQKIVISMKENLEKVKEQILNVL